METVARKPRIETAIHDLHTTATAESASPYC